MDQKHKRPDFVTNFDKPKNTEIKYISNKWYLYERFSSYDPVTRKSRKVSGKILGSITEDGFIPRKVHHSAITEIEVVELGASLYFHSHTTEIRQKLQEFFPTVWREIYVIAILRVVYGKAFKRISLHYETGFLSKAYPGLALSPGSITPLLKRVGRDRGAIRKFMGSFAAEKDRFILFDGHRILSASRSMDNAETGYDSKCRYLPQVNLIYLFSLGQESGHPEYYKQYLGSVPDVTAFGDIVSESGAAGKDVTLVADKGFGSEGNFELIEDSGMKYIIPLRRGNLEVKGKVPASQAGYSFAFLYHGRSIFCMTFTREGYHIHLYLDTSLLYAETNDLVARLQKKNTTIGLRREKEQKRRSRSKGRLSDEQLATLVPQEVSEVVADSLEMGTISVKTNRTDLNAQQVYSIYKQRQAIEQYFKTYDCTLGYDASYMRDTYSFEAWLFLNHLCSMMGFDALEAIATAGEEKNISLDDLLQTLRKVKANKIGDAWYPAKITRKTQALCEKMGFKPDGLSDMLKMSNQSPKN
ncbi:MAG: transposase [Candidatus Eremiobacteraeota bacterium]|nr:transposase [Candidatus Eremiobacteraeota bacterium]